MKVNNKLKAVLSVLISIIIVTVVLIISAQHPIIYQLLALIVVICVISYVVYDVL